MFGNGGKKKPSKPRHSGTALSSLGLMDIPGTDEFGNSVLTYYTCKNGTCVEIYDLKCQRRCNEFEFDMRDKNSVIISEERIIIAKCSSRSSPEQSRITNDVSILWNRDTQYSKMLL